LLKLGDLTEAEVSARCVSPAIASTLEELVSARRVLRIRLAGEVRFIPVEYAARYRDALGIPLPPGLADTFLAPVADALTGIFRRYSRTRGPFTTMDAAGRYGLAAGEADSRLRALHGEGKLLEGEFRPAGTHIEWCDPEVLQQIRRKTLSRLRREVVPAEQHVFARVLGRWQGVTTVRKGSDALLDAIEILQGVDLIASDLEREILPARVKNYQSTDLDALLAAGEIVWVGKEQLGRRDGRVAFYLVETLGRLLPPDSFDKRPEGLSERAERILDFLLQQGASFQSTIHQSTGGGFPNDTTDALWELTWAGLVTNDTLHPLRAMLTRKENDKPRMAPVDAPPGSPDFLRRMRARRGDDVGRGRWSLVRQRMTTIANATEWAAAVSQQLLVRNGIVMRETGAAENIRGGYASIYPALKTMEESGWVRRGMFVAGMGAAQFATPAAVDMLRSLRHPTDRPDTVHLAASDPANPYGGLLPWTEGGAEHSMARAAGASVVLVNGRLAVFLRRGNPSIRVMLPEDEPDRSQVARAVAQKLAEVAIQRQSRRGGLLIGEINEAPAGQHFLARFLEESGFVPSAAGFQMRRVAAQSPSAAEAEIEDEE
jgi:ATP-dependent Lhr-like helicase